jgi:hypothetical protein
MADDAVPRIEGSQLTAWSVVPGRSDVRLDLATTDGRTCSLVLPVDALSSLLMTLPRILQAVLDQRSADGSLRVAQLLGKWRLEQAQGDTALILNLGTPDGFEVAFALDSHIAGSLGTALIGAAGQPAKIRWH